MNPLKTGCSESVSRLELCDINPSKWQRNEGYFKIAIQPKHASKLSGSFHTLFARNAIIQEKAGSYKDLRMALPLSVWADALPTEKPHVTYKLNIYLGVHRTNL